MKRAFIPILIGIVFALIVITETIAIANGATAGTVSGIAWLIALWAVGLFFYFLPAFIAWQRDHHALLAIFILNLLLGWTFSAGLPRWCGRQCRSSKSGGSPIWSAN